MTFPFLYFVIFFDEKIPEFKLFFTIFRIIRTPERQRERVFSAEIFARGNSILIQFRHFACFLLNFVLK